MRSGKVQGGEWLVAGSFIRVTRNGYMAVLRTERNKITGENKKSVCVIGVLSGASEWRKKLENTKDMMGVMKNGLR